MQSLVSATGEAMPSLTTNRRRFLLGLAAASTAAAGASVVGAANLTPENPKLISLAVELPAKVEAYHAANCAYLDMEVRMRAATPLAPGELTELGTAFPLADPNQPGECERSSLGGYLVRPGEKYPRRIVIFAWRLYNKLLNARREMRDAKKDGRIADFLVAEAEVKKFKNLHTVAQTYEKKAQEVRMLARVERERLLPSVNETLKAFANHIAAMMSEEDRTMEGLVIKAEALAAWDRLENIDKMIGEMGHGDWHGKIAASILRHAEGGATNA